MTNYYKNLSEQLQSQLNKLQQMYEATRTFIPPTVYANAKNRPDLIADFPPTQFDPNYNPDSFGFHHENDDDGIPFITVKPKRSVPQPVTAPTLPSNTPAPKLNVQVSDASSG